MDSDDITPGVDTRNSTRLHCFVCSEKFSIRKKMYAHLRQFHGYQLGDASNTRKYVVCTLCEMVFPNITEHNQLVHGITVVTETKSAKQLCPVCGVLFSSEYAMKKHLRIHSGNIVGGTKHCKTYKSRIKCSECKLDTLKTYQQLRNHLLNEHNIEVKYEELHFDSFEEFEKWKADYENRHYALYSKDSSPKNTTNTVKRYMYYNCHRSYSYRGKSREKINKFIGTNKTGNACPSNMKVILENNSCLVQFWKTHVGHKVELQRCKLGKQVRSEIANKIQKGIPIQDILDEARDTLIKDKVVYRVHLLTKKDIYNVKRDYQIPYTENLDIRRVTDISEWVKQTQLKPDSPVVYFKTVGDSDQSKLEEGDFAIILLVPSQIPQLQNFGKKLICIDEIQYDSHCNFNLFIIMTVDDESDTACAAAFCFSNRKDGAIYQLFFETIRNRVGKIETSVFISDKNADIYNTWSSVMSEVPRCFWTNWHVTQDLRTNAEILVGNQRKLKWVDDIFKNVQQIDSQDVFKEMLTVALQNICAEQDLIDFGEYFINNYANVPEFWAFCYRQDLILSEIRLKSLHTTYQSFCYRMSKKNQFVKTVEDILKLEKERYYKHILKIASYKMVNKNVTGIGCLTEATNESMKATSTQIKDNENNRTIVSEIFCNKLSQINCGHTKSESITAQMITTINNQKEWIVSSVKHPGRLHSVIKITAVCLDCNIRCKECNICIHEFKCSCAENTTNNNICKHIHACASLLNNCQTTNNVQVEADEVVDHSNNALLDTCESELFEIVYAEDNEITQQSFAEKLQQRINLLMNLSEQIALSEIDKICILSDMDKIINSFSNC